MSITLRISEPAEAVAAVDHLLGFTPSESLVMLTFGAKNAFHARMDLPPLHNADHVTTCIDSMLAPALKHEVQSVLLVTYSARPAARLGGLATQLRETFTAAGVAGVDLMHVNAGMIVSHFPQPGERPVPVKTVKADVVHTRMIAEGHRVPATSRAAVAQRLHGVDTTPVGEHIPEVLHALLAEPDSARESVLELVVDAMNGARALSDVDVARIAISARSGLVRDELMRFLCPPNAAAFVDVFTDLVRRTPIEHREWSASLLAFGAWQAGQGALAWIAIDEAGGAAGERQSQAMVTYQAAEHPNALCDLIAHTLTLALPPSIWEDVRSTTTS